MRVAIIAVGTFGDVLPLVALGRGFKSRGFEVHLATHDAFETIVREHGLMFTSLAGDPAKAIRSAEGEKWICAETVHSSGVAWSSYATVVKKYFAKLPETIVAACEGADAVFFSSLGFLAADVAEKLGVRCAAACSSATPIWPSVNMSRHFFAWDNILGRRLNACSQLWDEIELWKNTHRFHDQWRLTLGLKPLPFPGIHHHFRRTKLAALYGCSPAVIGATAEWPTHQRVTGYWTLDNVVKFVPSTELVEFLLAGERPVFIGFGSLVPKEAWELVVFLCQQFDRQGIRTVISNSDDPEVSKWLRERLPASSHIIAYVPYSWLFPKVALAIHHGGNNTTGAALREAIPSIVVPAIADQHVYASKVMRLGVGTSFSFEKDRRNQSFLVEALRLMSDAKVASKLKTLQAKIAEEEGVETAVKCAIEILKL